MKRTFYIMLFLIVIIFLLSACELETWEAYDTGQDAPASTLVIEVTPVPTAPPAIETDTAPVDDNDGLDILWSFILAVAGLLPAIPAGAPAIAAITDTLKRLPGKLRLKDGRAPAVSALLNLVLFACLFFLNNEGDQVVKGALPAITVLSPYILVFFANLIATAFSHDKLAAIGIGKSYTGVGIKGMVRAG